MRINGLVLFAPLAMTVAATSLLGQAGRGTLTGTVTDTQGGVLYGAKISLDPGGSTFISDQSGQFTMTNLAPGDYTLTVNYSGFSTFTQKVTVSAGQTSAARLSVSMTVESNKEDLQVYAGRQGGEVEAINRTFTADNIINVLPADVIISLPNANIADALGRLPSVTLERDEGEGKYVQIRGTEPRLTNTTVDGVNIASAETVRQIKLDIIPSDLVESVQINKTLQANIEGDGIGGSVDLRTKGAQDRPTVYLDSTGGYTPIIGGRPIYQFDGTFGKRFLNKRLGLLGGGSYDYNGRGINDVEPGPVFLGGYDERDYQYYRSRLGFAGTADYRFSDTSNIYLKGLYSLFHNDGNRWDYNLGTGFDANFQPTATGSVQFGAEIRRPVQDLGSLQLGGRHVIKRSLFSWDVDTSIGRTRDNGYDDALFQPLPLSTLAGGQRAADAVPPTAATATTPADPGSPALPEIPGIQFGLNNSNPLVPVLTATGVNIYDPSQYYLSRIRTNNYYNPEVDLGFGASLSTTYTVGGHASAFEFGGRFRNVHKFANQDVLNLVPLANANDASLQETNFLGGFTDPNYYGNNYTFGPTVDYSKVLAFTGAVGQDPNQRRQSSIGNNFNFIEKVSAGYIMNTINLSKFRIVAGLRFENTNQVDRGTPPPNSPPVARNGSYLDALPSVAVRYGFTPSTGLRFVYGRGLSRPNFSDLVSFATVSPGGVRTTSTIGNPNLRAERADNLDLLYEQSLNPVGLIQAGIFYKRLQDPIIALQTTLADGTIQSQPQNGGSAYIYGFEVAFQQHFTYLPGMLNGVGLSANYGYTASQLTFPAQVTLSDGSLNVDRTDQPSLLRQAPNTWNISPTYDKRNLSVRLGLSYNGSNIFAYNYTNSNAGGPFNPTTGTGGGFNGPNGDQYLYAHTQVDLQGSYRLPKGFTAVAYGLNLTNEVFGFYQGNTNNPVQREFYRQQFGGGLRWSPTREK